MHTFPENKFEDCIKLDYKFLFDVVDILELNVYTVMFWGFIISAP